VQEQLDGRLGDTETVWRRKYEAFVERKTRDALLASLSPYVTEIDAHPVDARAVGTPWTRALFDGDFYLSSSSDPRRPACNLVFVQSKDRNTGARNPSSLGGGETDTHLIYEGLSRVAADGVLSGAETIRGGNVILSTWHPELIRLRESLGKPRHPVQIVATLQGVDLEGGLLFNVPSIRVILVTVGPTAARMQNALSARPWIQAVVMARASDIGVAFQELRGLGLERLSCIGGRRIATELVDAGLIQDVYLTTSPRPGGEPNTPMYPRPLDGHVAVRKRGTSDEAGVTFEHVRLT
jgi:5-amino-6-(5-phosphoribosylamino)uracil reductase